MIHLILLLFVLQGNNPVEWGDSCFNDFDNTVDNGFGSDAYFCKVVLDLNLNKHDIEKLGRNLDWYNYANQTANDFLDKWQFYQEHGIKETLSVHTVRSLRESLPPYMSTDISFAYTSGNDIKKFSKTFVISPLYKNRICNDDVENYRCIIEQNPYSFDESLKMAKNSVHN